MGMACGLLATSQSRVLGTEPPSGEHDCPMLPPRAGASRAGRPGRCTHRGSFGVLRLLKLQTPAPTRRHQFQGQPEKRGRVSGQFFSQNPRLGIPLLGQGFDRIF